MSPTKTGATREAYYMTCFSVLFSSLTLPFPGAYFGHSVGVSYAPQNGVLISFGGIWSSGRQPGPLSVSVAVTRSLTVTLHNFTRSLIRRSVTELNCTCSVSRLSSVIVQTSSVCKGPAVSTAGISFLPAYITENYWVEHSHQGRQERGLLPGCSSPDTSTVFCWQLVRSHCTSFFWCMDK